MKRIFLVFAATCTTFLISGPAAFAQASGETLAVDRSASATGKQGARALAVSDPVFMGDVIETDRTGLAQIRFQDDTRLVVGPNSSVTVDRFVLASSGSASEVSINAARGALRFITGTSNKQNYTINTPSATIGVRGTRFDVTVEENSTSVALYEGGVSICDRGVPNRRCAELEGACRIIIYGPQTSFQWVNDIYERTRLMDTVFPLAFRQQALLAEFRVQSGSCEHRDVSPSPSTSEDPTPESSGRETPN